MKSKSQTYAECVFQRVNEVVEKGKDNAGKYKSICKKSGSLFRNSGMVQYLAFLKAKGQRPSEVHHNTLYKHLEEELRELGVIPWSANLFEHAREISLPEYMHLSREMLHILQWHKRQAEILITAVEEGQ